MGTYRPTRRRPDPERAATLAALLARALPDAHPAHVARAVTAMQRAALAAKAWSELECSVPLTEAQQAAGEKRQAAIQRKAGAALDMPELYGVPYAAHRGVTLRFGGDPRGPCGWLSIDGQPGDGWDRDAGWGIY